MNRDINNAINLLNEDSHQIDEGFDKVLKKARRAIFGANDEEKQMQANRQKIQKARTDAHKWDKNSLENFSHVTDDDNSWFLKRLSKYVKNDKYGENVQPIYDVLVKLYKKYGSNIHFSTPDPYVIKVHAHLVKNVKNNINGFKSNDKMSNSINRTYDNSYLIGFCHYTTANDRYNYQNDLANGFFYATDTDLEKETNSPDKLKGKTDDPHEWGEKLNYIMSKLLKGISEEDADNWIEGAHQNESKKVRLALRLLKECGYQIR